MGDKRIVIEFGEKGRRPAATAYMAAEEAEREFDRVAQELEETGTKGDKWIRVGKNVVVLGREVHNIRLDEALGASAHFGDPEDSIWKRQF